MSITVETTTRSLSCKLTDDELRAIGRNMAHEVELAQAAENNKKSVQAQFKATIEAHMANISLASKKINTGVEYREIECDIVFDYDLGIRYLQRRDTGETVESRLLTKEEKQRSFSFAGELDASVEAGTRKLNGSAPEVVHQEDGFVFGDSDPFIQEEPEADDDAIAAHSEGLDQAQKRAPRRRVH